MDRRAPVTPFELVPFAERARSLQVVRAVLASVSLVLGALPLLPQLAADPLSAWHEVRSGAAVAAAYVALCGLTDTRWVHRSRTAALAGFSTALLADGLFLVWVTARDESLWGTGVIVVHVVSVTLLSSFRTGLKMAVWHSLLALLVLRATQTGLLDLSGWATGRNGPDLAAFLLVLWTATLTTATGAAVNERELRRRRIDAEELRDLGLTMQRCDGLPELDDVLIGFACDSMGAHRAAVVRRDDRDGLLHARGRGLDTLLPTPGSPLLSQAAGVGRRLVTHIDATRDPWLAATLPGARWVAVLPVPQTPEEAFLVFESRARHGGRLEARVLGTGQQALVQSSLAQARIAATEQLALAARSDGLTGLSNRRTFDRELAAAVDGGRSGAGSAPGSGGATCSLVIVDLDHFKSINDVHGHQAGDDVLRAVAEVLRTRTPASAVPARYGGEEFAVLLPGTCLTEAAELAEDLRIAVEELLLVRPVTASLGVAAVPDHATTPDGLVAAADAALYRAKEGGRNRVVLAVPVQHAGAGGGSTAVPV